MSTHLWYTWLSFGSDPAPARGPFVSVSSALDALERFRLEYGHLAGTYEQVGALRLVEFRTRAMARKADISSYLDQGGHAVAY